MKVYRPESTLAIDNKADMATVIDILSRNGYVSRVEIECDRYLIRSCWCGEGGTGVDLLFVDADDVDDAKSKDEYYD